MVDREPLGVLDRQALALGVAGPRAPLVEVPVVVVGDTRVEHRLRGAVEHAEQSLSCATRNRATSRSAAGSLLRWYTASIMSVTVPAISGRRPNTRRPGAPGPSGISMRAIARQCTTVVDR